MDCRNIGFIVCLDFGKAFDKFSHYILVDKIDDTSVRWTHRFLSNIDM